MWSRNSSIDIATDYGLDGRGSIPSRDKGIFFYYTASKQALGPTQTPIQWIRETITPGIKQPGREADQSPPSSAQVKNGGAIPALPRTSRGIVLN
jgi:hypothetical protein